MHNQHRKRNVGSAFNRLGSKQPVTGRSDIKSRLGEKERNFEEYEDDSMFRKTGIQSSVVAAPSHGPKKSEIVNVLNKDKARNQRMFGALLGTLQRFKKDQTKDQEKNDQRAELLRKLEEKEETEKLEVKKEREKLFLDRKTRQKDLKVAELKVSIVENHEIWEKETMKLKKFIKTKAKPSIFFSPKIYNDKLDTMLKESVASIDSELSTRKIAMNNELEKVEAIIFTREKQLIDTTKDNINQKNSTSNKHNRRSRSSNNSSDSDHSPERNAITGLLNEEGCAKQDDKTIVDLSENLITGEKIAVDEDIKQKIVQNDDVSKQDKQLITTKSVQEQININSHNNKLGSTINVIEEKKVEVADVDLLENLKSSVQKNDDKKQVSKNSDRNRDSHKHGNDRGYEKRYERSRRMRSNSRGRYRYKSHNDKYVKRHHSPRKSRSPRKRRHRSSSSSSSSSSSDSSKKIIPKKIIKKQETPIKDLREVIKQISNDVVMEEKPANENIALNLLPSLENLENIELPPLPPPAL